MNTLLEIGLSNALMATVLAIPAALATRFSRRPGLAHALWLLVLLKFITPPLVTIATPDPRPLLAASSARLRAQLFSAVPTSDSPPVALEETPAALPPAATPKVESEQPDEEIVAPEPPSKPVPSDLILVTPLAFAAPRAESPPAPMVAPVAPPAAAASGVVSQPSLVLRLVDWRVVAVATWCAGTVIYLLLSAWRCCIFHRLLRHGMPAGDDLQEEADRLASELQLRRSPAVWLVPGAVSPLVWAVVGQARVIVPRDLLDRLGGDERATLLAHELAHVQRRDHWVRWLELVATALFWWHPVAWLARWQIQKLEEQCCDASVVAALPDAARAYARALLKTVNFLADARPALPPAASGLGYVHLLKRRLDMILSKPMNHRLPWPVQLGALLFGLLVLPIAPQRLVAKDDDDPPTAQRADDDSNPPRTSSSDRRDLERRMRSLESRMDRVLRALERSGSSSESSSESSRHREASTDHKKAKEATRSARGKSTDDMQDLDVQMRDLDKRIREAVDRAVNPERMKELSHQIEEAVHRSINPERMDELSRHIEQAVNQSLNPERIDALVRRVEAAVRHGLAAEHQRVMAQQQSELAQKRAHEAADLARDKAERDRAEAGRRSSSASRSSSSSRDSSDLERRMSRLEEKMDRVLSALEAQRRPPK